MDTTDMTNAETTPTASTTASVVVMARPAAANLMHFTRPQPNMMGMARKNVNSAAAVLLQPHNMPPMMVAPEREVPGMMASTWKQPIFRAVFQSMPSTSVMRKMLRSAASSTLAAQACAGAECAGACTRA